MCLYPPVMFPLMCIVAVCFHLCVLSHPYKQCKICTVWMLCIYQNSSHVGHFEDKYPSEFNIDLSLNSSPEQKLSNYSLVTSAKHNVRPVKL